MWFCQNRNIQEEDQCFKINLKALRIKEVGRETNHMVEWQACIICHQMDLRKETLKAVKGNQKAVKETLKAAKERVKAVKGEAAKDRRAEVELGVCGRANRANKASNK